MVTGYTPGEKSKRSEMSTLALFAYPFAIPSRSGFIERCDDSVVNVQGVAEFPSTPDGVLDSNRLPYQNEYTFQHHM